MNHQAANTPDPLVELRKFARKLGWRGFRQLRHEYDAGTILWYIAGSTRDNLFLQINESPIGQAIVYEAAVYATRYAIVSGFHAMRLTPDGRCDDSEVQRLDNWLHRRWFDTPASRREYRMRHPECAGWSRGRIRREQLPHMTWEGPLSSPASDH